MVAMTAPWTVPASGAQFPFGPCFALFASPTSLAPSPRRRCAHPVWYACIRTRELAAVYVARARVPVCTRGYKACHVPAGVLPPGVRSSGPNQPANPNQLQPAGPTTIEIALSLWDWPRFPGLSLFPFDLGVAIARLRQTSYANGERTREFISGVARCRNRAIARLLR